MKVLQAAKIWIEYHTANSKENTIRAYKWIIGKFCDQFGDSDLTELSSDQILQYLNHITEGRKPQTKRVRFSHLSSFFNFLINSLDLNFQNPCDVPMMRKLFRLKISRSWNINEKEAAGQIKIKFAHSTKYQVCYLPFANLSWL